jgi:hypothetical protein
MINTIGQISSHVVKIVTWNRRIILSENTQTISCNLEKHRCDCYSNHSLFHPVIDCSDNPCGPNSVCAADPVTTYRCDCAAGFTGTYCDTGMYFAWVIQIHHYSCYEFQFIKTRKLLLRFQIIYIILYAAGWYAIYLKKSIIIHVFWRSA